jgi:hypothetical protein
MENSVPKNILDEVSYNFFVENRYKITDFNHRSIEYSAICNNGFIKLHSTKGKVYWLTQNDLSHLTPDWKFHVSVVHEDVPRAWDLVAKIFIENCCRSGVKVMYLKENERVKRGREITFYIYKHDDLFKSNSIANDFFLSIADEHSEDYWVHIFNTIERTLEENDIRSNGLAVGDYPIGKYVSLRNEAFVFDVRTKLHVYPSDNSGWNAADHPLPFNINAFNPNIRRNR